jgi:hypothetical protein
MKGTLAALGIHRRNQTVYHKHSPDIAGKILRCALEHAMSIFVPVLISLDPASFQ